MEREALGNTLAGGGGAVVTDVMSTTCAARLRARVIGCLDAGDTDPRTVAAPDRTVTVVHLYNFTDEGWRRVDHAWHVARGESVVAT